MVIYTNNGDNIHIVARAVEMPHEARNALLQNPVTPPPNLPTYNKSTSLEKNRNETLNATFNADIGHASSREQTLTSTSPTSSKDDSYSSDATRSDAEIREPRSRLN